MTLTTSHNNSCLDILSMIATSQEPIQQQNPNPVNVDQFEKMAISPEKQEPDCQAQDPKQEQVQPIKSQESKISACSQADLDDIPTDNCYKKWLVEGARKIILSSQPTAEQMHAMDKEDLLKELTKANAMHGFYYLLCVIYEKLLSGQSKHAKDLRELQVGLIHSRTPLIKESIATWGKKRAATLNTRVQSESLRATEKFGQTLQSLENAVTGWVEERLQNMLSIEAKFNLQMQQHLHQMSRQMKDLQTTAQESQQLLANKAKSSGDQMPDSIRHIINGLKISAKRSAHTAFGHEQPHASNKKRVTFT